MIKRLQKLSKYLLTNNLRREASDINLLIKTAEGNQELEEQLLQEIERYGDSTPPESEGTWGFKSNDWENMMQYGLTGDSSFVQGYSGKEIAEGLQVTQTAILSAEEVLDLGPEISSAYSDSWKETMNQLVTSHRKAENEKFYKKWDEDQKKLETEKIRSQTYQAQSADAPRPEDGWEAGNDCSRFSGRKWNSLGQEERYGWISCKSSGQISWDSEDWLRSAYNSPALKKDPNWKSIKSFIDSKYRELYSDDEDSPKQEWRQWGIQD